MKRKSSLLIACGCLVLLFSTCRQDDYNKNEFRCWVDGQRYSTPEKVLSKNLNYYSPTDSTLKLNGHVGPPGEEYKFDIEIVIPRFSGSGYYRTNSNRPFSCTVTVDQSTDPTKRYQLYQVYDGVVNITRTTDWKVAGYFHFVVRNPKGYFLHITNGRFFLNLPYYN